MKHYGGMLIPAGTGRIKRSRNKSERRAGCCEYCWERAGFPVVGPVKPRSWKAWRQTQWLPRPPRQAEGEKT